MFVNRVPTDFFQSHRMEILSRMENFLLMMNHKLASIAIPIREIRAGAEGIVIRQKQLLRKSNIIRIVIYQNQILRKILKILVFDKVKMDSKL